MAQLQAALDILLQGRTLSTENLRRCIRSVQRLSTPVLVIQEHIDKIQPQIYNKKKELRDILEDILGEFNDIESKRANLKQIELKANTLANEVLELKKVIEEKYINILPALRESDKKLNTLKKNDLNELRKLKNPPQFMLTVFTLIMDLIGITKRKGLKISNSWELAKIMFTDMTFIKNLTNLNLNSLSHAQLDSIDKWLKELLPEEIAHIKTNKAL